MKEHGQRGEPLDTLVWLVANRKITSAEHQLALLEYRRNRPTSKLHTKFYNHPLYSKNTPKKATWWNYMSKETRQQMRLFVKKLIRMHRNGTV